MSIVDIEASINSIPAKKEDLRKALEALQPYFPSFAPFTLQWKDFEEHFSSIEKSIRERFRELIEKESCPAPEKLAAALPVLEVEVDVEPRPELKSLCVAMDAKGLLSYLNEQPQNLSAIRRELISAFRYAPDSAMLVLDTLDCFVQSEGISNMEPRDCRRCCRIILECFHCFAPEIKQPARERARSLAMDLKRKVTNGKGANSVVVLSLLYLIVAFGLIGSFGIDYVLDLIFLISARKVLVDICRNSALEANMPALIEKLNNSGRHLDAIKFVVAFNLKEKYPPVSLLKSYINESKKAAQQVRKGNFSVHSKIEATTKEIAALRRVIKIVEDYNLESLYSTEKLQKSIKRLELVRAGQKHTATATSNSNGKRQQQQHPKPVKRPRLSTPLGPDPALHPYTPNWAHRPPEGIFYQELAGSYGLTVAPPLYNNGSASFSGHLVRPSEAYPQQNSTLHNHAYYDSHVTHGGYGLLGLPSSYSFRHYP